MLGGKDCLFFTVIGYNIRISLISRELVSGYLISILGANLKFAYDFWRHKQENNPGQVSLAK